MAYSIISNVLDRRRIQRMVSSIVSVHPHEISALIHSSSTFFFILSAYFVVLPLRDEGAISLGLTNLPELFVGSLLLTLLAAPVSTLIFSLPNFSKVKALVLIHRFFSASLIIFFILWHSSSSGYSSTTSKTSVSLSPNAQGDQTVPANTSTWGDHGWFYIFVRIALFLWVALLNLITISSTWARVIDVMDNESGSRLFGFIGAGATLGQLFGSLFAAGMAWLGPYLLLFSALLMELAARSSKGIKRDASHDSEELLSLRRAYPDGEAEDQRQLSHTGSSPKSPISMEKPQLWVMFDGLRLIISSSYLLYVALFLWLSALVSSFFYFQVFSARKLCGLSAKDQTLVLSAFSPYISKCGTHLDVYQHTKTSRWVTLLVIYGEKALRTQSFSIFCVQYYLLLIH